MQVKLQRKIHKELKIKIPAFAGIFLWSRENKIVISAGA